MARSSTLKTSRLDKLSKSLTDLHSEMQEHRRKQCAKEHLRKNHHSHQAMHKHRRESHEDKLIPKPKGRSGRSDGYALIEGMGLTEQRPLYNALCDIVRKLTMKYLDTSRSLSQQKDKLLVEKIIRKQYEGGWPIRDMIRQYLSNRSAKERRILEFFKQQSESSDESGTDSKSGSESGSESDSESGRRKKRPTSHHSQKKTKPAAKTKPRTTKKTELATKKTKSATKKTKPAAELFDNSSSENSESEPEDTTTKKPGPIKNVKRKRVQVQTDSESSSNTESALGSDSDTHSTRSKIMLRIRRPGLGKALTARTPSRKATPSNHDSESLASESGDSDHNMKELERSMKQRRIIRRQTSGSSKHGGANQTAKKRSKNSRLFTNLTNTSPTGTGGTTAQKVNMQPAHAPELSELSDHGIASRHVTPHHAGLPTSTTGTVAVLVDSESDSLGLSDLSEQDDQSLTSTGRLGARRCPGLSCKHVLPKLTALPPEIRNALETYDILRRKPTTRHAASRMGIDICNMYKHEEKKADALALAVDHGWPVTSIDFTQIPGRIVEMLDDLERLIFDPKFRKDSDIWIGFEVSLVSDGLSVEDFARLRPQQMALTSHITENARVGYYGMKGAAVIAHTLLGLFPAVKVPIDVLQPLRSHVQLLTYVLVPYCAARLIAEDLKEGYFCMLASSDVGEVVNPERDDDEELDEIYRQNIMSFTRQGKQRSRAFTIHDGAIAGSVSEVAADALNAAEVSISSLVSTMIISCSL
ncbi:hypothetical protein J3R82DRAFT_8657 [Butyriboletus roseoflavus]|nr:hypothetical protein J3R82DRAFT_8657 [Butyriboletus roseoflavus]